MPNDELHFQRETLDLIGFHEKILSSKKFRHLFCDILFVTDHPYAIKNDIFKDRDIFQNGFPNAEFEIFKI